MSTKDLIERLNRTTTTTRRTAPTERVEGEPKREVSTRVGARVIRRRRVVKPPQPDLQATAAAVAPQVEEAPTPDVVAEPEPVEEVVEEKKVAKPKGRKKTKKATEAAAAAEPAEAVEAKAPEAAAPEADAIEDAPPEEAAAATETAEAAEAAEVAEVAEPTEAEAEAETEAEAKPPAAEEVAAPAGAPETAASIAAVLPRADGSSIPNLPRLSAVSGDPQFPGLGSAVVRPPPGYDPANPEASRKEAKKETPTGDPNRWRTGAQPGRDPKEAERKDQRTRRPRRAPRSRGRVEMYMDDFQAPRRRRSRSRAAGPKKASPQAKAIKRRVEVNGTITVSNLARSMSVKSGQVITVLIDMGHMATANDELDLDTAQLVAAEFEHDVVNRTFQEEHHLIQVGEDEETGDARPAVVTIMGHVDHGKTTLLDTIRKTNVVDGEAGGITQHTAAYQVVHNDHTITFIDTPGHEAFTEMRSRGADVTDIVVLVVAADDGIMPQTVEAISHSKAAGVQIIVAVNKCDKPGVKPDVVRQALMEHELVSEEYGGDTVMCNVSALKGDGLDELLENILLIAEMGEYSANADRHAEGTVLEARLEKGLGPVATVLVQQGTLKRGDSVVLGTVSGRVRAMHDFNGQIIKEAGPSTPVEIHGLQEVPEAGDNFVVVKNDKDARTLAGHRADDEREQSKDGPAKVSLEDLLAQAEEGETVTLNLIVRADVGGTLEALRASLNKIEVPGTEIKLLHAAVGAITESDITLAHTYGAVVIGYNVRPDTNGRRAADSLGVDVRTYSIIYEAIEEVELALKGMLAPTIRETVKGNAEIRETFNVPKVGTIAGCMIIDGKVARPHFARLLRDGVIVWEGKLGSLRRFKDDVKEVEKGYECGMNLDGFNDIKIGDVIETFIREEVSPLEL